MSGADGTTREGRRTEVAGTHGNRYAIAFYATNDLYAIAVLIFVRLLRRIGLRDDADVVVLHLPLSRALLGKMREQGIVTWLAPEVPRAYAQYYQHCLLKLRVFELSSYDRVVYVDADAIPLKSFDPLFTFRFDGSIAAPAAYWLPQPFWGSYLMVVKPSAALWRRAEQHFALAGRKPYYDMDIVNAEFGCEIRPLPIDCICLNSEWEDINQPGFFGDPVDIYSRVSVVHFTALGKPWTYPPETARVLRPNAHPIFHDLWLTWWRTRDEIFAGGSILREW